MDDDRPTLPPQKTRVVLCRGVYCNLSRRANRLYDILAPRVDALNAQAGWHCLKLETANCLDMCGAGPNLVIYPDGLVFNGLDERALDDAIRRYLEPRAAPPQSSK